MYYPRSPQVAVRLRTVLPPDCLALSGAPPGQEARRAVQHPMGFFDQVNTPLETAWFSVLAIVSLVCFPFGIWMGRRFTILAAKLVPVICVLLVYENIVQALSNLMDDEYVLVQIGRTTHAAVIPLFLVVMFEVAYAVHKRRSVQFCGIVFDQGHRRAVEPCSWVLRNFVRILATLIFVLGVLVNYDIAGDDQKAGGTGLVDTKDASVHLLLALLPTTGMAAIALYIAVYMWKYGNDASIVVQSTVCNGWMFLFLGTLALLAGQIPPECCFRVVNESGQVLFLLSLIAIGREIGREVQAADNFSSFLQKENELESAEAGQGGGASITPATLSRHDTKKLPRSAAATASLGESPRTAATTSGRGAEWDQEQGRGKEEEWEDKQEENDDDQDRRRRREGHRPKAAAVEGVGDVAVAGAGLHAVAEGKGELDDLDDVTRPMPRRESGRGVSGSSAAEGGGGVRGRGARGGSGTLKLRQQRKRPELLLEDGGEDAFVSSMVEETEGPDVWKVGPRGPSDKRPEWEPGAQETRVTEESATAAGATATATAAPTPW